MKKIAAMFAFVLLAASAHAEQTVGQAEPEGTTRTLYNDCAQEQVSLYTTHTYNGYSMEDGQARFDSDKKRIEKLASDVGAKLKMTSESYSVNPMDYNGSNDRSLYNFSGNLNFEVTPANKGKQFFTKLNGTGINASLSYSKTNNCDASQGD